MYIVATEAGLAGQALPFAEEALQVAREEKPRRPAREKMACTI